VTAPPEPLQPCSHKRTLVALAIQKKSKKGEGEEEEAEALSFRLPVGHCVRPTYPPADLLSYRHRERGGREREGRTLHRLASRPSRGPEPLLLLPYRIVVATRLNPGGEEKNF